MVRSIYDWTQAKFEPYIKEERGKGRGKDYKPWITIQDFPSRGIVLPLMSKLFTLLPLA